MLQTRAGREAAAYATATRLLHKYVDDYPNNPMTKAEFCRLYAPNGYAAFLTSQKDKHHTTQAYHDFPPDKKVFFEAMGGKGSKAKPMSQVLNEVKQTHPELAKAYLLRQAQQQERAARETQQQQADAYRAAQEALWARQAALRAQQEGCVIVGPPLTRGNSINFSELYLPAGMPLPTVTYDSSGMGHYGPVAGAAYLYPVTQNAGQNAQPGSSSAPYQQHYGLGRGAGGQNFPGSSNYQARG